MGLHFLKNLKDLVNSYMLPPRLVDFDARKLQKNEEEKSGGGETKEMDNRSLVEKYSPKQLTS